MIVLWQWNIIVWRNRRKKLWTCKLKTSLELLRVTTTSISNKGYKLAWNLRGTCCEHVFDKKIHQQICDMLRTCWRTYLSCVWPSFLTLSSLANFHNDNAQGDFRRPPTNFGTTRNIWTSNLWFENVLNSELRDIKVFCMLYGSSLIKYFMPIITQHCKNDVPSGSVIGCRGWRKVGSVSGEPITGVWGQSSH